MSLNINKEDCYSCNKNVYQSERLAADGRVYHKSCFRCKKCVGVLKLGNYASMDGEVFCKVCFKKNFFTKGNYSEGFGKLKPQEQHDLKTGKYAATPTTFTGFKGVDANRQPVQKSSSSPSTLVKSPSPSPSLSPHPTPSTTTTTTTIENETPEQKVERENKAEERRLELLKIEENRKATMDADQKQREEKKRQYEETMREKRRVELKRIEDQVKEKQTLTADEIKERDEKEKKMKEDNIEAKKLQEQRRVEREREEEKRREQQEIDRIAKEREQRKKVEEEQTRLDNERRKKQREEVVFTSKADVKFSKPTMPTRGTRRLTPGTNNTTAPGISTDSTPAPISTENA